MGHSRRVSLTDLRAIFRLVGEVRELGAHTDSWRRHMLIELLRLVGGGVGMGHELPLATNPSNLHQFIGFVDVGWASQTERKFFLEIKDHPLASDPALVRYLGMLKPQQSVTCVLEDLTDPDEWHATPYFNEIRKPCGSDSFINAGVVLPEAGCVHGMCLSRPVGEKPFNRRERDLVQIFHEELVHIWRQATPPDPISSLPPRQRQIVQRLRQGDGEKQIAFRLGLSKQTVHAYVKALYKRVGASGRFELLQRLAPPALRFRPLLSIQQLGGMHA